jgi:diguanylate cyclase (GGDEF)-like protein
MLEYLLAGVVVLLGVSLYFNIKLSKTVKDYKENKNVLIHNAYFNPVTDLPNRTNVELVMGEQIDRVSRRDQKFLVCVLKLKNYQTFKEKSQELANDYMRAASDVLVDTVRDEDLIGQIEEDSFLILFNEYLDEEHYSLIIEKIRVAFKESSFNTQKEQYPFEISVGKSQYPDNASSISALITDATNNSLK